MTSDDSRRHPAGRNTNAAPRATGKSAPASKAPAVDHAEADTGKAATPKPRRKPAERAVAAEQTKRHDSALAPLIVGIGASAGGLEAFKGFFSHMPPGSEMAFVLVQHLAPHHKSILAELIGRSTEMQVVEATDGEPVLPGHVYVIPPDATLTISGGSLQVTKPAPPRQHRWPIDTFFTSLAEDQGDCAVSIVLSGSGSDGARGLRAIKEHGGLTLAQSEYDHVAKSGMPASAAATGLVDDILPVEEMPARLAAHQQYLKAMHENKGPDGTRQDVPNHLTEITRLLHGNSGHDFGQYKEKTVVRRIQRRMQVLQMESVPDYIAHLRQDSAELDRLFREMLISVTEFFRDPDAFELLQARVIPALLEDKGAADTLRVWVSGCATGEEAYSIAIALKEVMGTRSGLPKVQIFATDIDDRAVGAARAGRFRGPLAGVSAERLERWFFPDGEDFVVSKSIREMCIFSAHSLIKDPPFLRLDLISCRNLLIYLGADLQDRVVKVFHYALQRGGFLLLGPSEGLSRNGKLFSVVDKKHRLFQRREDVGAHFGVLPARPNEFAAAAGPVRVSPVVRVSADDLIERNARRALEAYSIPYVVIDNQYDVVRFCGDTGRYLQPSSGAASLNLFALLHRNLRAGARSAVQRAFAEQGAVVQESLSVVIEGRRRTLQLIVEPLPESEGSTQLCAVAFRERDAQTAPAVDAPDKARREDAPLHHLEQELEGTRLQLQVAIDQHETVNEELKSANEEYQSVNEELQSSNEELETSKEEMQSINEELQVVNAELGSKNTALLHANSDLRNLMESTQIATLFLDTQLRITGFTPTTADLFHVRQGDIGRPITEISSRIPYAELEPDVRQVLRNLAMVERTLQGENAVFLLRMRPYRTIDNVIDGVVLTFTDITERRRFEHERGLLAAIVDSSKDIIIGHTLTGIITSWNDTARESLGYRAGEVIGRSLQLLFPPGAPQLPELIGACGRAEHAELEMPWMHSNGALLDVSVTCSPVRDTLGNVVAGSMIAREIGERLRADHRLQASERRLAQLVDQTTAGVAQTEPNGHFVLVNPAFSEIVGRSAELLYTMRMQDIIHPEDLRASNEAMVFLLAGSPPRQVENRYLRPDGTAVWVINSVSKVVGRDGQQPHILAVVQNISEQRRAANHMEMMLGELNHRVKNTLASVQSIAMLTLSNTTTPESFRQTFLARLQALSYTHNLLARDEWNGVELRELVLIELAPYQRDDHVRVTLTCEALQLTPKTALALSMAMHELTTNAVKYGALSVPEGRVTVHCEPRKEGTTRWLRVEWREQDGPVVAPPTRRGFGSRLISDGLAFELDGTVSLAFDPAGVICTIDIPLPEPAP